MGKHLSINPGEITEAISFAQKFLEETTLSEKDKTRTILLTEETLAKLSEHATTDSNIKISTKKIGGKIILSYLITSILSIIIGISLFFIIQPGNPSAAIAVNTAAVVDDSATNVINELSLNDFISQLVPSNIIKPFEEANMIQIIIIAIFCGLSTGLIGQYSITVKNLFTSMNEFFMAITVILIKLLPVVSFCSMASMVMSVGADSLVTTLGIASFSIPLGATINMNGACIQLAITALAIARIYNVSISGSMLVIMCVTIIILSMGAPGISRVGIIFLTVILTQFNVPLEGLSLIIGIYPILDMFITVVNCVGDVVTSFVVAKSEKLLDNSVFEAQ